MIGEGAISEAKKKEEGHPMLEMVVWGVEMSAVDAKGGHWGPGTASLPEKKLVKGRPLFSDPSGAPGQRQLRIYFIQILTGNGEGMAAVQPLLRTEL